MMTGGIFCFMELHFAKRDAKYASYTQEDFDAEFEKFKKEFAEKHKNDESTSF